MQQPSFEAGLPRAHANTPHTYRELRGSEIRLLTILPGADDEPLACVLQQVALNPRPTFHCLSYCWGESGDEEQILLNDRPFRVRKSLHEALWYFRKFQANDPVFKGAFWVDAVCINQGDIDERSAQVARMTQIYSSAVRTIVWLGPNGSDMEDEAIGELFDKARNLEDWMWKIRDAPGVDLPPARFPLGQRVPRLIETFYRLSKDRPWFRRTWIVQEVVASAKDPMLFSGRHRARLSNLVRLYGLLIRENSPLVTGILGRTGSQLKRLSQIRSSFKLVESEDGSKILTLRRGRENSNGSLAQQSVHDDPAIFLAKLLTYLGGLTTTDPRDQIYALLALSKAAGNLPNHLNADYRMSYEEVYHKYAAFLIETTGNWNLINIRRTMLTGVPTWVPDFRHIWSHSFHDLKSPFPSNESRITISEDRRILQVDGNIIGRCVKSVPFGSDDMPCENNFPEAITKRLRLIRREIFQPASKIRDITPSAIEDEFVRSKRFGRQLWDRIKRRVSPKRSLVEKGMSTAESLAEERRIAVFVRAAFAVLDNGRILRCYRRDSPVILPEDLVCMFQGATKPCILRPVGDNFQYLGNCHILGSQARQSKTDLRVSEKSKTTFRLV